MESINMCVEKSDFLYHFGLLCLESANRVSF